MSIGAAIGAAAMLLVAGGYASQRAFNDARYKGLDPVLDAAGGDRGHRTALAGHLYVKATSPVWPLFGPRLESEVEVAGVLQDGLLRPYPDARCLAERLREGDYERVLLGLGQNPTSYTRSLARSTRKAGYIQVARGAELALYATGRRPQRSAPSPGVSCR